MKNPILLPTKHGFTELLVRSKHFVVHHDGTPATLAAVRENYWIVRGRSLVRKVIRRCTVCRRYDGKSFSSPVLPDLPAERISTEPPFSNTGIDLLDHCMCEVQGVLKIRYTSACLPAPPQGLFIWNLQGNCQPPYFY